jgi:hypothetical protein
LPAASACSRSLDGAVDRDVDERVGREAVPATSTLARGVWRVRRA